MRDTFAGELGAAEKAVHEIVRRAVMTLTIVADAVQGPMSVWSRAIAQSGRELRAESSRADAQLIQITARQAPVAGDLRLVVALIQVTQYTMLIANQFELISEQLEAIAADETDDDAGAKLAEMAKLAGDQLHRSLRAFVSRDAHVAREVDKHDDAIDKLNRTVFESALHAETSRERRELALRQVLIARSLERVGDNAVDIAGQVVFLVTGQYPS